LPLDWIVVKVSKGHFSEETHVELLNQVHSRVPQGCTVIVTGTANGSVLKLSFLTRKAVAFISTRGVSLTRCGFRV
jgi:hypothetical protein